MGSWGDLNAGPFVVFFFKDVVPDELFNLFQDGMYDPSVGRASLRYALDSEPDHDVQYFQFKSTGRLIADRLDILGYNLRSALNVLQQSIEENLADRPWFEGLDRVDSESVERWEAERTALADLGTGRWLAAIASAAAVSRPTFEDPGREPAIGSGKWLLELIPDETNDARWHRLRLIVHAVPDIEVILDVSALVDGGWLERGDIPTMPSAAQERLRAEASANSPIVVLTEGSTDAEFLSTGLRLLYPHLTDMVRFLDPLARSEGGAGGLVTAVKAFAAAGIANRIVAIFDDDKAASDALKQLKAVRLPPNIVIMQLPPVPLPEGVISHRNGRGVSGCIEFYLGSDTLQDDEAMPLMELAVHHSDPDRYEAHFVDKRNKKKVWERYRRKVRLADEHGRPLPNQDWSALRLILQHILTAHQRYRG